MGHTQSNRVLIGPLSKPSWDREDTRVFDSGGDGYQKRVTDETGTVQQDPSWQWDGTCDCQVTADAVQMTQQVPWHSFILSGNWGDSPKSLFPALTKSHPCQTHELLGAHAHTENCIAANYEVTRRQ